MPVNVWVCWRRRVERMRNVAQILVAGKTGQLGQSLSELCNRGEFDLVVAGRPDFDIEDAASIDRTLKCVEPATIINVAAYTAVDKAETEPNLCYAVNRDGAGRLAAAAWRSGVPFIHISTDYVFDGQKAFPYLEYDATRPLGVYGRSKLEGEQAILAAHPQAVILRTSWVYSVFGSNFLKTMLKLAKSRARLRIVNDQRGCPTSAHELAAALLTIASKISNGGAERYAGLYHLSGAGQATWYEFAVEIFANAETRGCQVPLLEPITTAEYPTPARRPPNSVLDCTKADRTFGVKLPPWSRSVRECVDRLVMNEELQPC